MTRSPLRLFEAAGIELEYMLVDRDALDVRPVADKVLAMMAGGKFVSDITLGPVTWSNELALHVIELKTTDPVTSFANVPAAFQTAVTNLHRILEPMNLRLLPTGMHPWMDPATQTQLWPHENRAIYQAFDDLFDCRRHGWGNVQSVHLNLPFHGDDEFARLHSAVRWLLPILPALTASSPIVDGCHDKILDRRLQYYADHCRVVPSLMGDVIPDAILDEATYRREIFQPIGRDISAHDPNGVFEVDFLNARAAIARFDRGSIEIRLMDVQEHPGADVAVCAAVTAVLKAIVDQPTDASLQAMTAADLRAIFDDVCIHAENTIIDNPVYLNALGLPETALRAGDVWASLLQRVSQDPDSMVTMDAPISMIQRHGTLASRIIAALGPSWSREDLHGVYDQLADCLERGEPFVP